MSTFKSDDFNVGDKVAVQYLSDEWHEGKIIMANYDDGKECKFVRFAGDMRPIAWFRDVKKIADVKDLKSYTVSWTEVTITQYSAVVHAENTDGALDEWRKGFFDSKEQNKHTVKVKKEEVNVQKA